MTDWSREEEEQFRALVRQAEAQSWDYYQRGGGQPQEQDFPPPSPPLREQQPQEPEPPQPPPRYEPTAMPNYWVNPDCAPQEPEPPQWRPPPEPSQPARQPRPEPPAVYPRTKVGPLSLPFSLDSETLLLAALIWLMVEEQADWKLILALAYILIV